MLTKEGFEKLVKVQKKLKAPKGQVNTFGKYKYRSCEDIVEAVKPLLHAEGLLLNISDELVCVGDRFYVKATARVYHEDGSYQESTAFAREEESKKGMDSSQLTGSTSSYARKYALNGLFAIDDTEDADATNTHGKEEQSKPKPVTQETKDPGELGNINKKINGHHAKALMDLAGGNDRIVKMAMESLGYKSSKEVPVTALKAMEKAIKRYIEKESA